MKPVPFNCIGEVGTELGYIRETFDRMRICGDGVFTKKCHDFLENMLGARKALLTTSCTHALEMAALLLDIQPRDEVILPSFTFVSTANAFLLRGAKPVFIDIRPDTLNLDEEQLQDLITPATRAIIPVHYAGVGCEMDEIIRICQEHKIAIVEDNAHGLFGRYKGRYLGTFGCLATQSFHETKNFSCGEGGALLINNEQFVERAEIIREKGTNRSLFFRGQIDKYTWVDIGSSYLPSDILAAVLFSQFEIFDSIQTRRQQVWERYKQGLQGWAEQMGASLPYVPQHCEQSYHMFYLLLPDLETRQALISHLKQRGILAVFHYIPLHSSPMGKSFGRPRAECPVTERVSERLLRLPMHSGLSRDDQDRVVDAIHEFMPSSACGKRAVASVGYAS